MLADQSLPVIPATEYPLRWARVQAFMQARGLDLLLAYGDDRAVAGPAHVRWLANVPVHFEPMCILMRPEGDPVLLCGPESDQYALLAGQVTDVRVLREFTHPDEDYPYSKIENLAQIVADVAGRHPTRSGSAMRVGVAGGGLMSVQTLDALHAALPGAEWLDVDGPLGALRGCKSQAELAVIRRAYRIAEEGLRAAVEAIRPGVTERSVAAEAEAAMRRAGAEGTGIDTIVASGPHSRPILARSTFRKIQADELVLLTVAPRYEGYHAAIGRPVLVGHPGPVIRRALETAWRAQEACAAALRPGAVGRDVEALGRQVVGEEGLGRYFLYSGLHSVGVIEFEPPIFGPSSDALLAEDMVISIDIPLFNAPWGGLRMEDGFRISATGSERLNDTPWLIEK
jgi:Xaa-Pro aminopeptidase